VTPETLN